MCQLFDKNIKKLEMRIENISTMLDDTIETQEAILEELQTLKIRIRRGSAKVVS